MGCWPIYISYADDNVSNAEYIEKITCYALSTEETEPVNFISTRRFMAKVRPTVSDKCLCSKLINHMFAKVNTLYTS